MKTSHSGYCWGVTFPAWQNAVQVSTTEMLASQRSAVENANAATGVACLGQLQRFPRVVVCAQLARLLVANHDSAASLPLVSPAS